MALRSVHKECFIELISEIKRHTKTLHVAYKEEKLVLLFCQVAFT